MDRSEAFHLLNLSNSATETEINASYWSNRADLERQLRENPGESERSELEQRLSAIADAKRIASEAVPTTGGDASAAADAGATLAPGHVLLGQYRIVAPRASGPVGVLYDAFDFDRNEPVSIEVLSPDLLADERVRAAFLLEARSLVLLDHPGIVRLFEVREDAGIGFLVMDQVKGRTLRVKLDASGATGSGFPISLVSRTGVALCEALHHAHAYVVHQAVLPETIILDPENRVKLMGFGLGRLAATAAKSGSAPCAKIHPIAPEQYQDPTGDPDPRSDQYAVGLVLYEMLTGQRPERPIPPVRTARPDVPTQLAAAVDRALRSEPSERFADMRSFGAALAKRWRFPSIAVVKNIVNKRRQQPSESRATVLPGRRRDRRLRVLVAAVLTGIVVLSVGAYSGWRLTSPGSPSRSGLDTSEEAEESADRAPFDESASGVHGDPEGPLEEVGEPQLPAGEPPVNSDTEVAQPQATPDVGQASEDLEGSGTPPPATDPTGASMTRPDPPKVAADESSPFGPPELQRHARAPSLKARSAALAAWRRLERATRGDTALAISDRAEVWRLLAESQQYFSEGRFEQAKVSWVVARQLAEKLVEAGRIKNGGGYVR